MNATARITEMPSVSLYVLALRQALEQGGGDRVAAVDLGSLSLEIRASGDSLWAFIRRDGAGGLAVRAAFLAGPFEWTKEKPQSGETARVKLSSALGEHVVVFRSGADGLDYVRITVDFTPVAPMLIPFVPRDLYPLDSNDDPIGAKGRVEAGQRGVNSGLVYFHVDEPAFGNVLYFQNLTALNDYFRATKTVPDGAVGGEWPELGYLLPSPPQSGTPPTNPLPAGKPVYI